MTAMTETLVDFAEPVLARDGRAFLARARGTGTAGGKWYGWIEFAPIGGGQPLHSGRETTQPNREDIFYWASGLTPVYLEGALARAERASAEPALFPERPAAYDQPPARDSVLDPFSVYRKGESLLRRQLAAFSVRHLVNIITAHNLSLQSAAALEIMPPEVLLELIVSEVRARAQAGIAR